MTGRSGARRSVAMGLAVLGVLAAAGCAADDKQAGTGGTAFDARATAVAEAWRAAVGKAGDGWRTGFVPLGDLTVLPAQGLTDEAKAALAAGRYVLQAGALTGGTPGSGAVVYPDGTRSTVAVTTAQDAFTALRDSGCGAVGGRTTVQPGPGPADPSGAVPQTAGGLPPAAGSAGQVPPAAAGSGGPGAEVGPTAATRSGTTGGGAVGSLPQPGCQEFTVTGATLGTAQIRTTRGVATAPAWLFTVTGVPAPVARIAVAQAAVLAVPAPSVPPLPSGSGSLVATEQVTGSSAQQLDFTIGIGACDRNPVGKVSESPDVVVVGGTVDRPTSGACTDQLKLQPVSVKLSAPLGDRVLIDAVTGRSLTF